MTTALPEALDVCWPVDTSCIPDWDAWDTPPDPDGAGGVPRYSPAERARATSLAAQTLRMLTGYRVGGCPVTVRPCQRGCRQQTWRAFVTPGNGSTPWHPVSLGGSWLNIGGCGHGHGCGCTALAELRLPASVTRVLQVKVDGMVLDPTAYRLDRGGYLVRMDGDRWPMCQNMGAPDSELGTWSVTYGAGVEVDGVGAAMAGLLAGQYLRACAGDRCDLPTGVTTIVRAGVTMTLGVGAFPEGKTGLREVDAYIERYNPHGLVAPPTVWSPDLQPPRTESRRGSYVPPAGGVDGGGP